MLEIGVSESALLIDIAMCINHYRFFSPGLFCCAHAPLELDDGTQCRPGIIVQVNHGPLKHRDWWAVMAAIERGVSRLGHHEFMDTIWKAGKNRTDEDDRRLIDDYRSGRMGQKA